MSLTKEQKQEYFKTLRAKWILIKEALSQELIDEYKAVILSHGLKISPYSFAYVLAQMKKACYDGLPYLDCKTYSKWQECGFKVRKGEKSKVKGITWIGAFKDGQDPQDGSEPDFMYPKEYALFHKSQVEAI